MESLSAAIATELPVQSVNDIADDESRKTAEYLRERVWKLSDYLSGKLYVVHDADALEHCETGMDMLVERMSRLAELLVGTDYADAATSIARWAAQLHERIAEVQC